jgi:hypothetical protein
MLYVIGTIDFLMGNCLPCNITGIYTCLILIAIFVKNQTSNEKPQNWRYPRRRLNILFRPGERPAWIGLCTI